MRIVFAGTPCFAAAHLRALVQNGFSVVGVLTQPDRPAGRGQYLQESSVKKVALDYAIPLQQPRQLKTLDDWQCIISWQPDILIVVAYGLLIPEEVLNIPNLGAFNVHASLLPRWRGAAPIQRSIEAGDTETGVGLMRMEPGLDTGPVLLETHCPIAPKETAEELESTLCSLGQQLLIRGLNQLRGVGVVIPWEIRPQSTTGVTYAHKVSGKDTWVNWDLPAQQLERQIRAFHGLRTYFQGVVLKIYQADVVLQPDQIEGSPGQVSAIYSDFWDVQTGAGILRLHQVQLAGGKILSSRDFLQGRIIPVGLFLGIC